jgi:hypothetical protein
MRAWYFSRSDCKLRASATLAAAGAAAGGATGGEMIEKFNNTLEEKVLIAMGVNK